MDLILYCRIQQLFIITLLLFASFVHPKTDIGEYTTVGTQQLNPNLQIP